MDNPPKIVCLIGSTKFKNEYIEVNKKLTLKGMIVLSVGLFGHADGINLTKQVKCMLDTLHLYKIDLADFVYVINIDGYIGKSTKAEIAYAESQGKPIQYLEEIQ